MPIYRVTETMTYRVEADSAEEAEAIICESENNDEFYIGWEREVTRVSPGDKEAED